MERDRALCELTRLELARALAEFMFDTQEAMGANLINTMAEGVAPLIEQITGGKVYLRILSNLADLRLARARVRLTPQALATRERSGEEIVDGVVEAGAEVLGAEVGAEGPDQDQGRDHEAHRPVAVPPADGVPDRGEPEPEKWTLEVPHKTAHKEGAPGLYGFSPQDMRVYIDNVLVTQNN